MDPSILPNFFIVGAPRAGTTSLYSYLARHPQVYMSPIKEPNYFARSLLTPEFFANRRKRAFDLQGYLGGRVRETVHFAYVTQWDDYRRLFEGAGTKRAIGEASTLYLQCAGAPAEIKALIPRARIIIGLRHPVERAYSEYLMNYTIGFGRWSIAEAVRREGVRGFPMGGLVAGSLYYEPVRRYLDTFGHDRVMVFLQEDMRDEGRFRSRVCEFLGVDHAGGSERVEKRNAASLTPRGAALNYLLYQSGLKDFLSRIVPPSLKEAGKRYYYKEHSAPQLSDENRHSMLGLFDSDTRKLEALIGRDLSHWLS